VEHYQDAEYSVFFSLNMLNAVQNFIFVLSVLLTCLLAALQISEGIYKVAMFVTVLTYLAQLQAPLSFFGSFYTQVQNNLVDAERMLALASQTAVLRLFSQKLMRLTVPSTRSRLMSRIVHALNL
jgi:ABC-type transport system involved in Fe-S cluster assembly fused permease/ATPase subunit